MIVPNWNPPSLNRTTGKAWYVSANLKRSIADLLAVYAMDVKKVREDYLPRRRVTVSTRGWSRGGRMIDPDNLLKLLLDAAKRARLIVDDSTEWLECPMPVVERASKGESPSTTLVIEDIP